MPEEPAILRHDASYSVGEGATSTHLTDTAISVQPHSLTGAVGGCAARLVGIQGLLHCSSELVQTD